MFQSLRSIEYILLHGAQMTLILQIIFYLSISFLPIILPTGLLFAVVLTYGRLSADSEIIAFKAIGFNKTQLLFPALVMGLLVSFLAAQTSFYLAPLGNRKIEKLFHRLGELKPDMNIKEGVFSEGLFDIVVYANKVDKETGLLKDVFIYDERQEKLPLTIVAQSGKLITSNKKNGNSAYLQLFEGSIHRAAQSTYTKVDFTTSEIKLFDPVSFTYKKKTPLSYTLNDLSAALKNNSLPLKKRKILSIEFHRRWALVVASFIFALLGASLGFTPHHRLGKSAGFVVCLGSLATYWICYSIMENMAKNHSLPIVIAMWLPNLLFVIGACISLKRSPT